MDGVVAHPVREDHTTYFTTKQPGILPRIIRQLLDSRAHAKKQIKMHTKLAKDSGSDDERGAALRPRQGVGTAASLQSRYP